MMGVWIYVSIYVHVCIHYVCVNSMHTCMYFCKCVCMHTSTHLCSEEYFTGVFDQQVRVACALHWDRSRVNTIFPCH